MKLLAILVVCAFFASLGWQHNRYRNARRGPAQDEQPLFYSQATFHVLTLLRALPDRDLIEAMRKFRAELEGTGQAKMVYAGRGAAIGLGSSQLGEASWDAAILVQYPSRTIYDEVAASAPYRSGLEHFAETYSHGLERPVLQNLAIPLALMVLRAYDVVTRRPSRYPFDPAPPELLRERAQAAGDRLEKLEKLREYSEDAVVVVNLLKKGTQEQQAADRGYGLAMAHVFAEVGNGPMHMGKAVTVEGDAHFDQVALVYYPGIDYMNSMVQSAFFNEIVGGKQPGDTLALPTVPVLGRL